MAKERKELVIKFRATVTEKELLEKKAKENGLSLSKFLIEKGLTDDEELERRIDFFENVFLKKRETLTMLNAVNLNNRLLLSNYNQLITRLNFYTNVHYQVEEVMKDIVEMQPFLLAYLKEIKAVLNKVKEQ